MSTSIFADDTAIWYSGKNLKEVQQHIQTALKEIECWCNQWGFKVSVLKTSFVLFSRKRKKHNINLIFNGAELKRVDSVKFLGMIFDSKLSWKEHVDYIIMRCRKRLNLLKAIAGSKWGADKRTMIIVYKAMILSVIDYGCEIYDSACKSRKWSLDRIQNQALRLCTGALRCTSIEALEVDCGLFPLDLRRHMKQVKCALHYIYSDNITSECFKDCELLKSSLFKDNFKPIFAKVKEIIEYSIPGAIPDILVGNFPPWEGDKIEVDLSLHDIISKKADSVHYMKCLVLEKLGLWPQSLKIYTDGSKCELRTGCSFYVPCIKFSKLFRLTNGASVFQAELVAILQALKFVYEKPTVQRVVILSDSLSAIQAIENESDNCLVMEILYMAFLLSNVGIPIVLCWIPSHIGVLGNEIVDHLAK